MTNRNLTLRQMCQQRNITIGEAAKEAGVPRQTVLRLADCTAPTMLRMAISKYVEQSSLPCTAEQLRHILDAYTPWLMQALAGNEPGNQLEALTKDEFALVVDVFMQMSEDMKEPVV